MVAFAGMRHKIEDEHYGHQDGSQAWKTWSTDSIHLQNILNFSS